MTFPLALGFLVYHIYLIWAGMTTNETAKWTDLKEDIEDGLVWRARIEDVKGEYPGPLDERIVYDPVHWQDQESRNGRRPSWAGGRTAEWWVIRTRSGAQPVRWNEVDGSQGEDGTGNTKHEEVIDERWVKVKSLKEIENLYDLGIVGNIRDGLLRPWKGG